jgi:ABC-type Mn2+/Zn2+ transport system permease subunit
MHQFTIVASLIGGVVALFGFIIAYKWDLPVGPTDVVLLGVLYALAWGVAAIVTSRRAIAAR